MTSVMMGGFEWLVLKEIGDKTLVISQDVLFNGYFDDRSNVYEKSKLNNFLNDRFINIIKDGGFDTQHIVNGVWPLTLGQYNIYIKNKVESAPNPWFLRSPGKEGFVLAVDANGEVYEEEITKSCGLRPAMMVDTEYIKSFEAAPAEEGVVQEAVQEEVVQEEVVQEKITEEKDDIEQSVLELVNSGVADKITERLELVKQSQIEIKNGNGDTASEVDGISTDSAFEEAKQLLAAQKEDDVAESTASASTTNNGVSADDTKVNAAENINVGTIPNDAVSDKTAALVINNDVAEPPIDEKMPSAIKEHLPVIEGSASIVEEVPSVVTVPETVANGEKDEAVNKTEAPTKSAKKADSDHTEFATDELLAFNESVAKSLYNRFINTPESDISTEIAEEVVDEGKEEDFVCIDFGESAESVEVETPESEQARNDKSCDVVRDETVEGAGDGAAEPNAESVSVEDISQIKELYVETLDGDSEYADIILDDPTINGASHLDVTSPDTEISHSPAELVDDNNISQDAHTSDESAETSIVEKTSLNDIPIQETEAETETETKTETETSPKAETEIESETEKKTEPIEPIISDEQDSAINDSAEQDGPEEVYVHVTPDDEPLDIETPADSYKAGQEDITEKSDKSKDAVPNLVIIDKINKLVADEDESQGADSAATQSDIFNGFAFPPLSDFAKSNKDITTSFDSDQSSVSSEPIITEDRHSFDTPDTTGTVEVPSDVMQPVQQEQPPQNKMFNGDGYVQITPAATEKTGKKNKNSTYQENNKKIRKSSSHILSKLGIKSPYESDEPIQSAQPNMSEIVAQYNKSSPQPHRISSQSQQAASPREQELTTLLSDALAENEVLREAIKKNNRLIAQLKTTLLEERTQYEALTTELSKLLRMKNEDFIMREKKYEETIEKYKALLAECAEELKKKNN